MCITVISVCHKHMLANTAYHQNKFYSKSKRQYAKRRTTAQSHQLTILLILLNVIKKLSHIQGGCLGAVTLWYNVKHMPK